MYTYVKGIANICLSLLLAKILFEKFKNVLKIITLAPGLFLGVNLKKIHLRKKWQNFLRFLLKCSFYEKINHNIFFAENVEKNAENNNDHDIAPRSVPCAAPGSRSWRTTSSILTRWAEMKRIKCMPNFTRPGVDAVKEICRCKLGILLNKRKVQTQPWVLG
jgi:hypothetical protein